MVRNGIGREGQVFSLNQHRRRHRAAQAMPLGHVIDSLLQLRGRLRDCAALRDAVGVRLSRSEARDAWGAFLEHKRLSSEATGRGVGLRAAAIDYIENVRPRG